MGDSSTVVSCVSIVGEGGGGVWNTSAFPARLFLLPTLSWTSMTGNNLDDLPGIGDISSL